MSKHKFQTEVSQLLHLIIHSLYSHNEIFLRELISNSSDALDKLKYLTLTDTNYKKIEFNPKIDLKFSDKENTLTISDSGLGMSKDDLKDNLGTIAWMGKNDKSSGAGPENHLYGDIMTYITDASENTEAAAMMVQLATNGSKRNSLVLIGDGASEKVDANILQ